MDLSDSTYHALGLHMHQPPGNLRLLAQEQPWEARQIMLCYERPLKYLRQYGDVGRLHVGFSGILLEQFLDRDIVAAYADIVDIPRMLEGYASAENIELVGMGYYHPVFPIIPKEDWPEQIARGKEMVRRVFGREPKGFWPPEMGFSMEMVPYLAEAGYQYVLVDSVHVRPLDGQPGPCAPLEPYLAEYEGHRLTIVPRDRDLSNAQQSGMDAGWFEGEVRRRVAGCPPPHLITTWSDGENGGWFRQTHEPSGFWGHFFAPYMERVRGGMPARPVLLSDYLRENPPKRRATAQTGSWNIGSRSGFDFSQWAGSPAQRRALEELYRVSQEYHETTCRLEERYKGRAIPPDAERLLEEAHRLVLQAETSCYLFWGDAWVDRIHEVIRPARELLARVQRLEGQG